MWVAEDDRAFASRLARYCARNPVALERLTYDRAAKAVTYHSDKSEGPTAGTATIDPLECLARVLVHIPDQGQVTTRDYGWYANRPRGHAGKTAPAAALLPQVFELGRLTKSCRVDCRRVGALMVFRSRGPSLHVSGDPRHRPSWPPCHGQCRIHQCPSSAASSESSFACSPRRAVGQQHVAHFHAYWQDQVAVISIEPIDVIAGSLPTRQRRLVEAWAELHQQELLDDWSRLQHGQAPVPIDPLA